jgi:hypothetical protein
MKMVNQDEEHLRLLSILHYVWGGLAAFGSCFIGVYALVAGGVITLVSKQTNGPPAWLGMFVFVIMGAIFLLTAAQSALSIWAGRCLAQRKNHTLCLVEACLSCLSIPLGTALGVFTIIVLQRPSVKQMFEQNRA